MEGIVRGSLPCNIAGDIRIDMQRKKDVPDDVGTSFLKNKNEREHYS